MYLERLFGNPPGPNNWIDCAADLDEMNAAFDIADAEANSDKRFHDWFAQWQQGSKAPRRIFAGYLGDLVRDIARREGFTLGVFPVECIAYALACAWIDSQQQPPQAYSEWLDMHRGKAGARRYNFTFDPRDGTRVGHNYLYARNQKEAEQLAARISGLFGYQKTKVVEVK